MRHWGVGAGAQKPGVVGGPKAANLPRKPAWTRDASCVHASFSRLPNCFLPRRPWPSNRAESAKGQGAQAEPVRRPGSGPSCSQTRWTSKMGIKIPSHFLRVGRASGQHRARVFPPHAGDVLVSKSGSDPENPWKPPSTTPGKAVRRGASSQGSRELQARVLLRCGKRGLGTYKREACAPAGSQPASLRQGHTAKGSNPFPQL